MKVKELIKMLSKVNLESEVFFEEDGCNQGGESEIVPLGFKCMYGDDKELTIVLEEN